MGRQGFNRRVAQALPVPCLDRWPSRQPQGCRILSVPQTKDCGREFANQYLVNSAVISISAIEIALPCDH